MAALHTHTASYPRFTHFSSNINTLWVVANSLRIRSSTQKARTKYDFGVPNRRGLAGICGWQNFCTQPLTKISSDGYVASLSPSVCAVVLDPTRKRPTVEL